jgi:hypothetical protein
MLGSVLVTRSPAAKIGKDPLVGNLQGDRRLEGDQVLGDPFKQMSKEDRLSLTRHFLILSLIAILQCLNELTAVKQ